MDDGEALLKAIIADPDEDVPRLAYADWLTENGWAERGEFIRVQCELARSYPEELAGRSDHLLLSAGGNYATLRIRERELTDGFNRDRADCCPRAFPGVRLVGLNVDWYRGENLLGTLRRGFLEHVIGSAADWLAHADAILAANPVQVVTLTTMPDWYHADGTVWLCDEVPSGLSLGVRRGRKCLFATTETRGNIDGRTTYIEALLMHEWPTVKTWNLPPETRAIDLAGVRVSEATHRALARAGRRITEAARRRNPR